MEVDKEKSKEGGDVKSAKGGEKGDAAPTKKADHPPSSPAGGKTKNKKAPSPVPQQSGVQQTQKVDAQGALKKALISERSDEFPTVEETKLLP